MKRLILGALIAAMAVSSEENRSTQEDRTGINLTVYNSNRALIQESRNITLSKGVSALRYEDVSSNIMTQTLGVSSKGKFEVLEQNYEFDLINRQKLLDKYVGKEVLILNKNEYKGKVDTLKATLLSNNGMPIFKQGEEILIGITGEIVLPNLPKNLYAKPTIKWLVKSNKLQTAPVSISYLTTGISWKAAYVLNLAKDDKSANLNGWVTLNNSSGAPYDNATLKLVAGDVNTVREDSRNSAYPAQYRETKAMAPSGFAPSEKKFFDYHLYTYPRKISVANNQKKQLSLLTASNIKTEKVYIATQGSYAYYYRQNNVVDIPVDVMIKFASSKKGALNQPMPKGIVRIYKKDSDGSQIFVGEDKIKHTAIGSEIMLKTGKAFDVSVKQTQTNYEKINNKKSKTTWEVEFKNSKDSEVTVRYITYQQGEWKITSTDGYKKLTAGSSQFSVKVPANGSYKLKYELVVTR